ncbi:MAG: 16S rRNA (guanine(966)-N(2))-methyltransferase RsmD, partial [Firmicutes bacterium]|nr:16S rRNA (guanine(966)-N(2))-methyltransferase RsmD [Bacillota bacterium]
MPVLRALDAAGILAVNGLVIVEARIGKTLDGLEETGFVITREKEYKNNKHIFLKRKEEA